MRWQGHFLGRGDHRSVSRLEFDLAVLGQVKALQVNHGLSIPVDFQDRILARYHALDIQANITMVKARNDCTGGVREPEVKPDRVEPGPAVFVIGCQPEGKKELEEPLLLGLGKDVRWVMVQVAVNIRGDPRRGDRPVRALRQQREQARGEFEAPPRRRGARPARAR